MELRIIETTADSVHVGYSCACGCTPSVTYEHHRANAHEGCCCGNEFAVGPDAARDVAPRSGFRNELQVFDAPWGERLEAAWSIGPSVHAPDETTQHNDPGEVNAAIDPVCGMTVEPEQARAKGLVSSYEGLEYFFCGKGCKLDFEDEPTRYLDPNYTPSM